MSADFVSYNGYDFGPYSDIKVSMVAHDDDSARTTLYMRHKVRVESTIYAESTDTAGKAGSHFAKMRRKLSEKGAALVIRHRAFDINDITVNASASTQQDVSFGPHPRVIEWEPLGPENACHVVWECEFSLPICQGARTTGLAALNYSVTYRIDTAGYTTRSIHGYLEIMMTRNGRNIPDTADAYRDSVVMPPLENFQRTHDWALSSDKRRADFQIVDTEVRGPNIYPAGVVNIQASHSANFNRRQSAAVIPQTIRANIELIQGVPRSRAWEIFKAIVLQRMSVSPDKVFIETLGVDEQLFGDQMSFHCSYVRYVEVDSNLETALSAMFTATGIGQPLRMGAWNQWKKALATQQSHRGMANLKHDPKRDQIFDPCANVLLSSSDPESGRIVYTPQSSVSEGRLRNTKPSPRESYLKFEAYLGIDESNPSASQVAVGDDDIIRGVFNPNLQNANLGGTNQSLQVGRFVESAAGNIEVNYRGLAERVGYPIPRPDQIKINGVTLLRRGKSRFMQKFCGNNLGQPVYQAGWNLRYVCANRPGVLDKLNAWRDQ